MASSGRRGRPLRVSPRVFWAAVGLMVGLGLAKLYGPLASHRAQQTELARLRMQKASLLAEQERLTGYKETLASESGLERAARREDYARPGERRLVFVREKAKPTATAPSEAGRRDRPTR